MQDNATEHTANSSTDALDKVLREQVINQNLRNHLV
jgi:hypothetical protein